MTNTPNKSAESKVEKGSTVEVSLEKGKIVVAPVAETEYTLDRLFAKMTKKNLHSETYTNLSVGNEAW